MLGNWLKTTVLMAAIVALFGVVGAMIGGEGGMLLALLLGGGMNIFAYWFSDKMVLKMYDAHEVDAANSPYLYNMVAELAARAGMPMPRAEAHPETAQMMIMNPLSGGGLAGLFATHPATAECIAQLRAMLRRG